MASLSRGKNVYYAHTIVFGNRLSTLALTNRIMHLSRKTDQLHDFCYHGYTQTIHKHLYTYVYFTHVVFVVAVCFYDCYYVSMATNALVQVQGHQTEEFNSGMSVICSCSGVCVCVWTNLLSVASYNIYIPHKA